jgi:Spy/CpxP family protein refolding chaperone
MIRNPVLLAVVLCLLAATPGLAQKENDFPFRFGPIGLGTMMKEVGLSEAQMRQFGEIFQSQRHALVDLRAEVEKKEGDLRVLLDAPQVDLAQTERAVDAFLEARNRLAKANTMMMVRMRQVVTLDQWRRIEELQRRVVAPPPRPPAPPAQPAPPAAPAPPRPAPRPEADIV